MYRGGRRHVYVGSKMMAVRLSMQQLKEVCFPGFFKWSEIACFWSTFVSKIATKIILQFYLQFQVGRRYSLRMQNETTNTSALNRKRGPHAWPTHSDMPWLKNQLLLCKPLVHFYYMANTTVWCVTSLSYKRWGGGKETLESWGGGDKSLLPLPS